MVSYTGNSSTSEERFRYFRLNEFLCKCCGEEEMDVNFLYKLDATRGAAGIPFRVLSGYRCAEHNREIGGRNNSAHLRGKAADIRVDNSYERFKVLNAAFRMNFRRIGIGETFIHLDHDNTLTSNVIWLY